MTTRLESSWLLGNENTEMLAHDVVLHSFDIQRRSANKDPLFVGVPSRKLQFSFPNNTLCAREQISVTQVDNV